jgi:hypothetical protein
VTALPAGSAAVVHPVACHKARAVRAGAATLKWPLGHAVQAVEAVDPAAEVYPAAQLPVQVVEEVLGWNLPLGQGRQVPESSYCPLRHAVQAVEAVEPAAEVYPAAQLPVQVAEEVLGWNLPLGQAWQAVKPALGLNLPTGQAAHADDEVEAGGEEYPARQLAHEAWPVLLYLLTGHCVQATEEVEPVSGLNVPAAQATHDPA